MKVMTQTWSNLLFAHWAFEPDLVRSLLPRHLSDLGIELDTFEGQAYAGLVPFQMRDLRIRGLPRIPTTSDFPEINVRTYVTYRGRPAVWFFSLDTPQVLPTLVARLAFRLPYCLARATVTTTGSYEGAVYASRVERRWPTRHTSSIAARIGSPISPTPLTEFLTSRWGLVATSGDRTFFGAVDHAPWPLCDATLLDLDDHLGEAAGLPAPTSDPLLLFSPGVATTISSLERIGSQNP